MNQTFKKLLLPALLVAAVGCADKEAETPPPAPEPPPVAAAPEPEPAPAEPTSAEVPVAEDFEAEVATSITADNLDDALAKLEADVTADEAATEANAAPPAP